MKKQLQAVTSEPISVLTKKVKKSKDVTTKH